MILKNNFFELEVNENNCGNLIAVIPYPERQPRVNLVTGQGIQTWLKHGSDGDPGTDVLTLIYQDFFNRPFRVISNSSTAVSLECDNGELRLNKEIILTGNRICINMAVINLGETPYRRLQLEYFNLFAGGDISERSGLVTAIISAHEPAEFIHLENFGQRNIVAFRYNNSAIMVQNKMADAILRMTANVQSECAFAMVHGSVVDRGFTSKKFILKPGATFTHSMELELIASMPTEPEQATTRKNAANALTELENSAKWNSTPAFSERWSHLILQYNRVNPDNIRKIIAELLVPLRYNGVIFELNRGVRTSSHPELAADWALNMNEMKSLIQFAKNLNLKIGVEFNTPGHQHETMISEVYPELIEKNDSRGRAALCVSNASAMRIVTDIFGEYLETFEPDLIHFGGDEVQFAGDVSTFGHCPLCRGIKPNELFGNYVSALNAMIPASIRRGMWGDMFLTHHQFGRNVTGNGSDGEVWRALSLIPHEMEIFDWHYYPSEKYESVDYFMQHGFPTWCVTAFNFEAMKNFLSYAQGRTASALHTTWAIPDQECLPIESMIWAAYYQWFGCEADKLPVRKIALETARSFWK